MKYKELFGFKKEPFSSELDLDEVLQTPAVREVYDRVQYVTKLGAIGLVTGEVGSGKSTALRWSAGQFHPSKYKILWITATSGTILEIYRQLLAQFDIFTAANSKAKLTRLIRKNIINLIDNKLQPLLIIDEASLLRLKVFKELHTITQFEGDSKPWLPIILAGQKNLGENLVHKDAGPLASRVITRTHLKEIEKEEMEKYLIHHLNIAGLNKNIFEKNAITAIYQSSGGLLRRANNLARAALISAASGQQMMVSAEHVRLAETELI